MTRTEKQAEKAKSAASRKRGQQEENDYWAMVVRLQTRRMLREEAKLAAEAETKPDK